MTGLDEQVLRWRLRQELAALPVRPAPVPAVTHLGRAVRARRRRIAVLCAALVTAAVTIVLVTPGALPAILPGNQVVTMNSPDPAAPGGVFASGTAHGRPWNLSLTDIAGRPATSCVPAVMLNGHNGDVLRAGLDEASPVGYPGFLTLLPSLDKVGFGFVYVRANVTKVAVTLADKTAVAAQPVGVNRCGTWYHLAGFAYARAAPTHITVWSGTTRLASSVTGTVPFGGQYHAAGRGVPTGLWENTPAGVSLQRYTGVVAHGVIAGRNWAVTAALGTGECTGTGSSPATAESGRSWLLSCWSGECYTGRAATAHHLWASETCVPVEPAPAGARLVEMPPAAVAYGKHSSAPPELTVYAGTVASRTRSVIAYLSDGTRQSVAPVPLAGRLYIGLAVPKRLRVTRLALLDQGGISFYALTSMPAYCGVTPVPPCDGRAGLRLDILPGFVVTPPGRSTGASRSPAAAPRP